MADLNIFHDPEGRMLTVWFGPPQAEYVCEETGDEVVLMKDKAGRVIGFERLNYATASAKPMELSFLTLPKAG